ncbi:replication initiation protein, partial [Bacillus cereus]
LNNVLKKSEKIYCHVTGKGSQRQTGLSTLTMLYGYAMESALEQREKFIEYIGALVPRAAKSMLTLLQEQKSTHCMDLR